MRRLSICNLFIIAITLAFVACLPVFASSSPTVPGAFSLQEMTINLLGGLAFFLFGMEMLADELRTMAGGGLRKALALFTSNRFSGVLTGATVTAVVQSSSITTVLVVGFVSAGVMSMAQSISVIMGANIGTTITAQMVAFKITKAALPMISLGFGLNFFVSNRKLKSVGAMLLGLGIIFFGMKMMGDAMSPLRTYPPFLDLLKAMSNPFAAILVSAVFTALVQSSSATTGIVITMASQGLISLELGITLSLGSNLGTCITAMLAAIGKPREAVRAAMVHVIFNLIGVLIWIGFVPQLAQIVGAISPTHPELDTAKRLAAELPRQIANAHTLFNVANTFIMIGFTGLLARLVERLVPDKPLQTSSAITVRYLDPDIIDVPALALGRTRYEIAELGKHVQVMLDMSMPIVMHGGNTGLEDLATMDDAADERYQRIIDYLAQVSLNELGDQETAELFALMNITHYFEQIGDLVSVDLVSLGQRRLEQDVAMSEQTRELLLGLHKKVSEENEAAIRAIVEEDHTIAQQVVNRKEDINHLVDQALVHHAGRLNADAPNRLAAYTIETEMVEKLKRIYYFSKRVARSTLEII